MKQKLFTAAIILLGCFIGTAQTGQISITISDIKKVEGDLYFLLYDEQDGFPKEKEKALKVGRLSSYDDSASYTFENVPYGVYAVAFFQDENENGKLDSNLIGIPKEPVGASNMTSFGKPSYRKCKFELDQPQKSMKLKFVL
ncbi:DUF2141 domain-containing protein [Winogradskyella sp.]|uniref:DUF2141 domain-containing protein n=1 Tax=Winogradskyella sp. TaxID=1883156 RepID=UPI00262577B2|nr:DUF2141 domain-containing protein [Winogradskyella sp.]